MGIFSRRGPRSIHSSANTLTTASDTVNSEKRFESLSVLLAESAAATEPPTSSESETDGSRHDDDEASVSIIFQETETSVTDNTAFSRHRSRREFVTANVAASTTPKTDKKEAGKKESKRRSQHNRSSRHRRSNHVHSSRHERTNDEVTVETEEYNPFANKEALRLEFDMTLLTEALNIDKNTQAMLAYYDARSLEDFCLMGDADWRDLLVQAKTMHRALPPLQVRKVEVLRDWVQDLITPEEDLNAPMWIQLSQPDYKPKKGNFIPKNWRKQFKRDIPRLKQELKEKGENLSTFPLVNSVVSIRETICGF